MGLYQRENGKWGISYTENGQRIRRVVGTRREAEAELRLVTGPAECTLTFNEYALGVLKAMSVTNPTTTVETYSWHLAALMDLGNPRLDEVDLAMVREYQTRRLNMNRTPATVNREVLFLSRVLSQAVEDDLIARNPLVGLKGKLRLAEPQGLLRYLELEELRKLEAACHGDPLLGIIQVAVLTGLRMREIFQLQWSRVDRKGGCVAVLRKHKRDYSQVPFGKKAFQVIDRQPRKGTFVFPGKGGGRRTNCAKAFAAAVKRSGLQDVTFHTLRHTFASHAVMNGMDLRTLQEILGHTKLDMVMRYAHLAEGHKVRQLERLQEKMARAEEALVTQSCHDKQKSVHETRP